MVDTLERQQTGQFSDDVQKNPVHLSAQIIQASLGWNKGSTDFSSQTNVEPKAFITAMKNVRDLADRAISQYEGQSR